MLRNAWLWLPRPGSSLGLALAHGERRQLQRLVRPEAACPDLHPP